MPSEAPLLPGGEPAFEVLGHPRLRLGAGTHPGTHGESHRRFDDAGSHIDSYSRPVRIVRASGHVQAHVAARLSPPSFRRAVGAALAGYAVGLIPTAATVARLASGGAVDLRTAGSGNPGGMNAFRLLGRRAGLLVMGGDILKGFAACAVGKAVAGDDGAHAAGVGAVAGHCYPVTQGFRGGKGIATSFGQCLATFPAFAPLDAAAAVYVGRIPGLRRPALASVAISGSAWLLASVFWWRRRLPNLWGPRPTGKLPLANAATIALIGSTALRRR